MGDGQPVENGGRKIGVRLSGPTITRPADPAGPGLDSIALILQTSGTTSDPKLAPRTHGNLMAAGARTRHWFALTPDDRCLCATPLYHAQALEGNVLPAMLRATGTWSR